MIEDSGPKDETPHFNILTRTSQRPEYFKDCCRSIDSQTYRNVSHHVITDDLDSVAYIRAQGREPLVTKRLEKRQDIQQHFPWNLYMNEMYQDLTPGYVIYLDDDDEFVDENVLKVLSVTINGDGRNPTLFWRVQFPDGIMVPQQEDNFAFGPGNVHSCGFCFHTKYIDAAVWDEFKEGDFRVAHKVKLASHHVFYLNKLILTGLQRKIGMGGFGARDDKIVA